MRFIFGFLAVFAFNFFCGLAGPAYAKADASNSAAPVVDFSIKYEKFKLANGLTVIVYKDRKTPMVTVNVTYKVGSKDEPVGRSGFAHLFEHLMFAGSEHSNEKHFTRLQAMGAVDQNGTTSRDRTNYYATVPSKALEQLLFLESDRMGHLLAAVTQERLKEQVGVVKNEKRSGDSRPYGNRVNAEIFKNLYPIGHPYHHLTIGSEQDLDNADLKDVQAWFRRYYGAANAILTIAGDIDIVRARSLAKKYFGHIASGPPLAGQTISWSPLKQNKYASMQDLTETTRIYRTYIAPAVSSKDSADVELLAKILGEGPSSRLHKRLVDELQLATQASAVYSPQLLSGELQIIVTPSSNADTAEINAILDEEIAKLMNQNMSKEEIQLAKMSFLMRETDVYEGIFGKSWRLVEGELYTGNADHFFVDHPNAINAVSPAHIKRAASKIFDNGYFELTVLPFKQTTETASAYDRSKGIPPLGPDKEVPFPAATEKTLSNGVKLVVIPSPDTALVHMDMSFDAGKATHLLSDTGEEVKASATGDLAMNMLDAGTKSNNSDDLARKAKLLGARIDFRNWTETSSIKLTSFNNNFDPSLRLVEDILLDSTFPKDEFEKAKKARISVLNQFKLDPNMRGSMAFLNLLYGKDHPYSGYASVEDEINAVEGIRHKDVLAWRDAWLRPDNLTIFVGGDVDAEEIFTKFERTLGQWEIQNGPQLQKKLPVVENPKSPRIVVIDQQDLQQSAIFVGRLIAPAGDSTGTEILALNDAFGGSFASRINLNLRSDKGWTYGAHSSVSGWISRVWTVRGPRPFLIGTQVQTNRTKEAMVEILKEVQAFTSSRPYTSQELAATQADVNGRRAATYEDVRNVMRSAKDNHTVGLPVDYHKTEAERFNALTIEQVRRVARNTVIADDLTWVIVGDWDKIKDKVKNLTIGPIEVRKAAK